MPLNEARENRILQAIIVELNKIGQVPGPSSWLTTPTVYEGFPNTSLPEGENQVIYVAAIETRTAPEEDDLESSGPTGHQAKTAFAIWVVSGKENGSTDIFDMKADVLRCLYAAEGTLQSITDGWGVWPGSFIVRLDLWRAGYTVGQLTARAEFTINHTDP
jgi:hypothetical protein